MNLYIKQILRNHLIKVHFFNIFRRIIIEKCTISKMSRHIENLPQKMSSQENKYPFDTFHFYALSETLELQREKPGK